MIKLRINPDHSKYVLTSDEGDELEMVRFGMECLAIHEKEILEERKYDLELED
jgi:hypothetical protein